MADVTGPISSLPGARHAAPQGSVCDDHPDRPAVARVQGETDSMGSEMFDLCQECLDAFNKAKAELDGGAFRGRCGRCDGADVPLFPYRDYDEGMSGPVYYYCRGCRSEQVSRDNEEARAELEAGGYDDPFYDDPSDIDESPDEWEDYK